MNEGHAPHSSSTAALLQLRSSVAAGYAADGKQYSLLEYLLWETEQMHGRIRRYTSPDEHAFFARDLPPLVLPPIQYPEVCSLTAAHYRHCFPGGSAALLRPMSKGATLKHELVVQCQGGM